MDLRAQLIRLLDEVLNLEGRASAFRDDTALLGAVPELDSMGVVAVITALEDQLGVSVEDDEIDGETFGSFGSLLQFVQGKLAG